MKNKALLALSCVFTLLMLAFPAHPQKPEEKKPQKLKPIDVRPILQSKKPQEGMNLITTSPSGLSLYAKVENGKIMDWVVKDSDGKVLPTTIAKGRTTCWRCVIDKNGDTQCF
jgi:hypothetical protein